LPSSQPDNAPSSPILAPRRQRLFVAEIVCLLCARPAGTARVDRWPPAGLLSFRPADSSVERQLTSITGLRCLFCGGSTAVDEVTERTVRLEGPTDWQAASPRRGRPPKWLVLLRQAGGPGAA
jgi:hypothetical protein